LRVAELVDSTALVVIFTTRPEPVGGPAWPAPAIRVHLNRLEFVDSLAIMQAVLRVERMSPALAQRLHDRAGGNPFFLEQLCRALLERGAVAVRDGEALVGGDDNELSLPDTVEGVIRTRLDNLNPQALEMVRIASVIGWEFDRALLAEVVPAAIDLGTPVTVRA
jgi:predicted ATPase